MLLKRVFLIVLDSFGLGALPDAAAYGDAGSNTLHSISQNIYFSTPNLISLGLGNIRGCGYIGRSSAPKGCYGRLRELSAGKDTTTGHWEMAGIVSEKPFPTYPEGFPKEITEEFSRLTDRRVICNKPYSGTEVIKDYGREHIETGALIVYTSADSVFQIAAHEEVVPREQLYEYCRAARGLLCGEHAVGRVIARPFRGGYPDYVRTDGRHDFSLLPPKDTVLDAVKEAGLDVIAVGKINDIFASKGITRAVPTSGNSDGMIKTSKIASEDFHGLCFVNLVDFDMLYGHRNDVSGYAGAMSQFDAWLPCLMKQLHEDDALIITADHGCDPGFPHTDHTREYVPLLIYGKNIAPVKIGTVQGFACVAATVAKMLGASYDCSVESLI